MKFTCGQWHGYFKRCILGIGWFSIISRRAELAQCVNRKCIMLTHLFVLTIEFQAIKAIFPGGTCGFDKEGGCVMIYPLNNILPKCMLPIKYTCRFKYTYYDIYISFSCFTIPNIYFYQIFSLITSYVQTVYVFCEQRFHLISRNNLFTRFDRLSDFLDMTRRSQVIKMVMHRMEVSLPVLRAQSKKVGRFFPS